jgi:hypothetical protein
MMVELTTLPLLLPNKLAELKELGITKFVEGFTKEITKFVDGTWGIGDSGMVPLPLNGFL